MKTISRIAALVLLASLLTAGAAEARTRIYVQIGPPPLVYETRTVAPYPGLVWLPGYYQWTGIGYAWVPGRWVAAPYRHARWIAGRWRRSYRGYYWQEGGWRRPYY